MRLTLREEIIVLTCLYCFCLFTIPVILFSARSKNHVNGANKTSAHEKELRREILTNSISILNSANRKRNESAELTISELMSSPPAIFHKYLQKKKISRKQARKIWNKFNFKNGTILKSNSMELPLRVDWRDKGVVVDAMFFLHTDGCSITPIIEIIESMTIIKTGSPAKLKSRDMLNSYDQICPFDDICNPLGQLVQQQNGRLKVKDYSCNDFVNHEELILLYLAKQGPVIAAINSARLTTANSGVILHECEFDKRSHRQVVQIVGYDMTDDVPYYIIKNSRTSNRVTSNGYSRLAMGVNVCGIAEKVVTLSV